MLGVSVEKNGKVLVREDFSIPGRPEVFVVGDLAHVVREDGRPVPGVCPAANQEGAAAAKNIIHILRRQPTRAFRYFNKGDLAVIGRSRAVADFGWLQISGFPAWVLWLFVHIMYLVDSVTGSLYSSSGRTILHIQRGVRVITNAEREHPLSQVT